MLELLGPRRNVGVLPTEVGVSGSNGEPTSGAVGVFPGALRLLERRRREVAEAEAQGDRSWGTGLLRTTIDGAGGWTRTPGPSASEPFPDLDAAVRGALDTGPPGGSVTVAVGTPAPGGGRRYRTPGPLPLARTVVEDGSADGGAHPDTLPALLRGLGASLRALHAAPAPATTPDRIRPLAPAARLARRPPPHRRRTGRRAARPRDGR